MAPAGSAADPRRQGAVYEAHHYRSALVLSLAAAAALLAVDVSAGDRSPSPHRRRRCRSWRSVSLRRSRPTGRSSRLREAEQGHRHQADRGLGPERSPGPPLDVLCWRHAARPVPAQLPLLRAVRSQGRARARSVADERVEALRQKDFYKQALDAFTFHGDTHLPAAEHLQPRRLLQQEAAQPGEGQDPEDGLDLEADGRQGARSSRRTRTATARPTSTASASRHRSSASHRFVWSNGGKIVNSEKNPTRLTMSSTAPRAR